MKTLTSNKHFITVMMVVISNILIFSTIGVSMSDQTNTVVDLFNGSRSATHSQNGVIEATRMNTISFEVRITNWSSGRLEVNGTKIGTKNQTYNFTIYANIPNNDFLKYSILWGDGSLNSSGYLPNGTVWSISHSWAGSGKYQLIGKATDNNTFSEQTSMEVFIDVTFISDIGFLYDVDFDGSFDSLYINSTERTTPVHKTPDGSFYLDLNGDGTWDSSYNPSNGSLTALSSNVTTIENPWFFILIMAVAVILIAGIVYLYKKNYF